MDRTHVFLDNKASLSALRRRIRTELHDAGIDPASTFECVVAITEACTNALQHGRRDGHSGSRARVGWEIDRDCIRFFISDFSSTQWDPTAMQLSPLRPSELEVRERGYGLVLMCGLMDEVDIRSEPTGTTVELVKNLGR